MEKSCGQATVATLAPERSRKVLGTEEAGREAYEKAGDQTAVCSLCLQDQRSHEEETSRGPSKMGVLGLKILI